VYKKLNFGNSQKKASRSVILISLAAERCRMASRPACSEEPLACCKNKTEGKNMNQISNLDKKLGTPETITLFEEPGFKGTHKKSKGRSKARGESRGGMMVDLPFAQPLPPGLIYVTAAEAAKIRRQGLSSFWRQVKQGEIPQPVRVSARRPRWLLSDILPSRAGGQAGVQLKDEADPGGKPPGDGAPHHRP
jgi:hypothetical protein